MRSSEEGRGSPKSVPLVGGKCCTPPGQLLPLDRTLWPLVSQGGGTITGVSGERRAQCQRAEEHLQVKWAEQDSMSPESPQPMQEVTLPPGFKEVMACLLRDPSTATTFKVPLEPMQHRQ